MLLGKSREIAPQRMKRSGQSENDTQLWMYLVVKVKSDAVTNNIAKQNKTNKEQYCIGTWNVRSMNQGKLDMVK